MNNNNSSIGLPAILFVVFLVLKLCNVIDWSWWWVTAPLWGCLVLPFVIVLLTSFYVRIRK